MRNGHPKGSKPFPKPVMMMVSTRPQWFNITNSKTNIYVLQCHPSIVRRQMWYAIYFMVMVVDVFASNMHRPSSTTRIDCYYNVKLISHHTCLVTAITETRFERVGKTAICFYRSYRQACLPTVITHNATPTVYSIWQQCHRISYFKMPSRASMESKNSLSLSISMDALTDVWREIFPHWGLPLLSTLGILKDTETVNNSLRLSDT